MYDVIVTFCLYKQEKVPTNKRTSKFGSTSSPVATNSQPQQESNVETTRHDFHAVVARPFNPQPNNSDEQTRNYFDATIASQQVSLLFN